MTAIEMMHRPLAREQIVERGACRVGWSGSRMDEYRARTAPIIKQMAGIEAFRPSRSVLISPDGGRELGPEEPLPPAAEATLAELRSLIESIARELFPDVAAGSQKT